MAPVALICNGDTYDPYMLRLGYARWLLAYIDVRGGGGRIGPHDCLLPGMHNENVVSSENQAASVHSPNQSHAHPPL